jgi:hypothetical protein
MAYVSCMWFLIFCQILFLPIDSKTNLFSQMFYEVGQRFLLGKQDNEWSQKITAGLWFDIVGLNNVVYDIWNIQIFKRSQIPLDSSIVTLSLKIF